MLANIRGTLIVDLGAYLETLNQDPARVFAQAGFSFDIANDQDTRVPVEAPIELIEISARLVDQPDFGLRFARFRGMPDLGPLALLLREQKNLGDALAIIAQSFYLHSNALYLSIIDDDDSVILAADLVTSGKGLSRQSAEMIVCAIIEMLRHLLGPDWAASGVMFRNAQSLPTATYRQHLGVVPDFAQEYNGIILQKTDLSLPLRTENLDADYVVQTMSDDDATATGVFVYRVRQLIVLTLPQGEARATRVANLLQINRRTLHRRLQRADLTFSDLLCEVRLEFALQYVRGSDRSFSEISLLVGFESLAVFSRWFRRSTGMSPSSCRMTAQTTVH
jgi:AraC-like DNA-binding protein